MNKLIYKVFVGAILLFYQQGMSQDVTWHKGVVVTANRQVLIGEISMQSIDLLLFRSNQTVDVYPAHKIKSVRFYDDTSDMLRRFLILDGVEAGVQRFSFYEIVTLGKLTIVRQQNGGLNYNINVDAFAYDYFIVDGAELIKLHDFRQKLFSEIMAHSPHLREFVKTERLNPNYTADAIRMILFYNKNLPLPA